MGLVIGIDVGGSTTKIIGLNCKGEILSPLFITAADPVTSLFGAFGKDLSLDVCNEHAGDLAYILRLMW